MSKKKTYHIRKTIFPEKISVIINDGLGVVAGFNFDEAVKMCQLLNANSNHDCKYELVQVNQNKDD